MKTTFPFTKFCLVILLSITQYVLAEHIFLDESFDVNWPAPGWSSYVMGLSNEGWTASSPGYGGQGFCAFHNNVVPPSFRDDWLVSPRIDLNNYNLTALTLSFATHYDNDWQYGCAVNIYQGDQHPWSNNYITVFDVERSNDNWGVHNINLNEFTGWNHMYISFQYFSEMMGQKWYVDDVKLTGYEEEPNIVVYTQTLPTTYDPATDPVFTSTLPFTETLPGAVITYTLPADSFVITDTMPVWGARWSGHYSRGGPEGNAGFILRFFENKPPNGDNPYDHPGNEVITYTLPVAGGNMDTLSLPASGTEILTEMLYTYQMDFDVPFEAQGGNKYWFSVQMIAFTDTIWGLGATPDAVRDGCTLLRGYNLFGDSYWHTNMHNRDLGFILFDIPEPVIAFAFYIAAAMIIIKMIFR